jgi:hypothetical protein
MRLLGEVIPSPFLRMWRGKLSRSFFSCALFELEYRNDGSKKWPRKSRKFLTVLLILN